ncbi:MAG TPA: c-type cytochrome [Casimicrobiaceae bacterium]|jgi:cytochrome c|nr:c-type cytochrome [Casimicrobiaceae bacterium]
MNTRTDGARRATTRSQFRFPIRGAAIVLGFSALAVASAAAADQLEDMMKKEGCNACHSEDKKIVGPSYKDVAAKYRGNPKAVEMLVEKVKKGGSGVWGPIPMPPNSPRVSDADIKKMVELILALK